MKRLNLWLNSAPPVVRELYRGLAKLPGAQPLTLAGGKYGFRPQPTAEAMGRTPPGVSPQQWKDFLLLISQDAPSSLFEAWAITGLFTDGVRAYCPTADEFSALAHVELRVPWDAYRQPFETMCVAIPDGVLPSPVSAEVGDPCVIVARHNHARRLFSMTVQGMRGRGWGVNLTGQHTWAEGSTELIEDHVGRLPDAPSITPTEDECLTLCRRAVINACLLLVNKGAVRLGSANPEYESKLRASLQKKSLPESVRRANQSALHMMPVLYGFEQHVRVFEREGGAGGSGDGHTVRPHWRRGHWAQQSHGPAGSLRKLVFRPAVMVNAERFAGDAANTRAVYTTANTNAGAA